MVGETLGHYKILELLGEGGMGKVYRAEDTHLNRQVALKVLPDEVAARRETLARFQQEARTLAAVDHPNIVTIYSVEESSGVHFITMQLVEGRRLTEMIPQSGMSTHRFFEIAVQLAQGLAAAHERGVIHRDLKPGNIMVTEKNRVKILDFGLAKPDPDATQFQRTEVPTQPLTQEGRLVGTVPYMSPEQLEAKTVDSRSDIFSFGVVLYELATGRRPFEGDSALAVASSIIRDTPESVDSLKRDFSPEVGRVIDRCLEKDPERRFQTALDLHSELQRLRDGITSPIQAISGEITGRKRSWSIRGWATVLTAVLLLGAGALFHFSRQRNPGHPTTRKSVAVIPFENLDPEAESDYFSDGITEDILTQLGKIGELTVVPSVATKKFKGGNATPAEIGAELRVATLLRGSVRREANRLRIACQLVDTGNAEQIWAETYDREAKDIFAIQDEIARQIVANLGASLSPEEQTRFNPRPTASLNAYDYYLKGRALYYQYEGQRNNQAIDMFKRALKIDQNFAPAHAGLADAYALGAMRYGEPFSWLEDARKSAEKAISLDPNSAEGYKALGLSYVYRGKYRKALEAYLKAVDLNPNYYTAVTNAGTMYLYLGMLDEAVAWFKRSLALNPIHSRTYQNLGDAYRLLDDFENAKKWFTVMEEGGYFLALLYVADGDDKKATEQIKYVLASDPENPLALDRAGEIAHYVGDWATAKAHYEKAYANYQDIEYHPYAQAPIGLGQILLDEGNADRGEALLQMSADIRRKRIAEGNDEFYPRYDLALIDAIRGDKNEAIYWLREAIEAGWRDYRLAQKDPWFECLHDEDVFKELMKDVENQVAEMRARMLRHDP
jgi:serine/threonine protein kinase/Tfp pilus assembly protein PilF